MRVGVVPERLDEGMAIECALHGGTLDALPAPVHQPQLEESGCVRRVDVLLDNRRDVARRKRVQIELRLYGNPMRRFVHSR